MSRLKSKNIHASLMILFTSLPVIYTIIFPGKIVVINSLSVVLSLIITFHFILRSSNFFRFDFYTITAFIFYNAFTLVRGFFIANDFTDYKILIGGLGINLILYNFIFFGMYSNYPVIFIRNYYDLLKKMIIPFICILFIFSGSGEKMVILLKPHYLLILISIYLSKKSKYFIYFISLFSIIIDLQNRYNIICIVLLYLIVFLIRNFNIEKITNLFRKQRKLTLSLMYLMVFMSIIGLFNPFQSIQDLVSDEREGNILVDSRSKIYEDVWNELNEKQSFLIGLGLYGKTSTFLTDSVNNTALAEIYKKGRNGTESSMLNFLQYGGLIGCIIYILLFSKASYIAITHSNNIFFKALGLWVMLRGVLSFIEDRHFFNINTLVIFLTIGLCFNHKFRNLSDDEFKSLL
ncbi:hypothetical protein [Flammeovirga sp. SJP92]|uniref:hypothetical protein n=1 Tax=Flammeovirga sp. SJP92 TaxID=1775430 RepID=UPI00079207A7|nr:hypothetical protein [Flammeovirga sp. SJP92]KXX72548.1 hypothetical protein AVL50_00315 [Flammeovirga sp. SJP92]